MASAGYVLWGGGPSRSVLVEMVLAEAGAPYERARSISAWAPIGRWNSSAAEESSGSGLSRRAPGLAVGASTRSRAVRARETQMRPDASPAPLAQAAERGGGHQVAGRLIERLNRERPRPGRARGAGALVAIDPEI